MDDVIVTIPFCHESFTSIEVFCRRGKDKVTLVSPKGEIIDLQNQSMRFKQIYEYESKFFVNKSGKGQKKMFAVQVFGVKEGVKKK